MNILLVEDDQKTADLIQNSLKEAGYTVIYAPDGKAALEISKDSRFDLAIMDIMLPFVDGFTVIETNQIDRQANGFCFFVLGEFTVLDAEGNPID